MATEGDRPTQEEVDASLGAWRQGDCVLGEHWFAYRVNPRCPLTPAGESAAEQATDLAEEEVAGFVVVTQTCDIVRTCSKRPYVEVCPLLAVPANVLHEVRRGRQPGYLYIPGVADKLLIGDLDRVMTVEKAVMLEWSRTPGCATDQDVRELAYALARKRARFAFPDDFVELAERLSRRIKEKHDRASEEGNRLRALREIRIQATPSWTAASVELFFWFIRSEVEETDPPRWDTLLAAWLNLVPPGGRYTQVDGQVVTLDDMKAAEYVDSDPLDLQHLSSSDHA